MLGYLHKKQDHRSYSKGLMAVAGGQLEPAANRTPSGPLVAAEAKLAANWKKKDPVCCVLLSPVCYILYEEVGTVNLYSLFV